jgi:fermentation-respiration switch protein FrsA (DUF1100 family)
VTVPPYIGYPLAAVAVYGALYVFANGQVFHPMKYPDGWWEVQDELGAQDVAITTADGVRLHGWWSPADGAGLATLYLHGNAGNVSHRGSHIRAVNEAGTSILVIDYRGYGKSGGRATEKGLYADAEAGYQFLREKGYLPEQIVVHGESLGTAVAVELATRVTVAGVVLEAPFTSARDVAGRVLPLLGPLLVRGFDTRAKIGGLRAPLLVVHGESDEIIPFDMGESLFDKAPEPKFFWPAPNAGHNNIVEAGGQRYLVRLREFYGSLAGAG